VSSPVETAPDGQLVLDRLRELPGGPQLLELAAAREDVELIGGAVRDLLLDPRATPRELDVIVVEDAAGFARELARALHAHPHAGERAAERSEPTLHERFRTALVRWPEGEIDVATRRSERYPAPGALPEVAAGTREEDLRRRDFTVNTLAVALGGAQRGRLEGAPGALEDLRHGLLRALHERSFLDDPTRLLRLARYRARLGFEPEQRTASLAAEAIAGGALDTVSRARIGAELRLALTEPDPVAALRSLDALGVLAALHEAISLDPRLARAALDALPACDQASPHVLLLASLLLPGHDYDATDYQTRLRVLLDELEFSAVERERAVHSALLAPRIAERLRTAQRPSQIYEVAHGEPLEAVALAAAIAAAGAQYATADAPAADAARRWLSQLRLVTLEIRGEDLLAAGIVAGPEVGRRLRRALVRKLDGELDGAADSRAAELRAALEEA
jgi:tRNA nucleotidyltransferase (CCA-adding enzyme)